MPVLSGGVMVAQESLELFVMVRIHAGQPAHSPVQSDHETTADALTDRADKEAAGGEDGAHTEFASCPPPLLSTAPTGRLLPTD